MNPFRALRTTVLNVSASGASLLAIAPIYVVFVNALKTQTGASSMGVELPTNPQWGNFATVIDHGKLLTAFFNSVLYAFGGTVLAVVLASLAAYVLARQRSRRHKIIYLVLIMGIAIPTNFVTLMKVMQVTHLIDTQIGMILLYAATQIPFSLFLIYAFVDSLPKELDEAAFLDGCSPLRTYYSIILPMLTPVLVTCGILSILNIWNEFLLPLYFLNSTGGWPMTLAVFQFFGQFQSDWSLVSADIVLTILPVILVYVVAQRWILSGVSAGAVKG